jgi:hypothetical protein
MRIRVCESIGVRTQVEYPFMISVFDVPRLRVRVYSRKERSQQAKDKHQTTTASKEELVRTFTHYISSNASDYAESTVPKYYQPITPCRQIIDACRLYKEHQRWEQILAARAVVQRGEADCTPVLWLSRCISQGCRAHRVVASKH